MSSPTVAIFAPNPLLTVTLEIEGEERESVHFHAGGQGVWVAGMARCMGSSPVLCGLLGGESGELLRPLIDKATGGHPKWVQSAGASGCYVTDRRTGHRELLAMKLSDPPSRHELDELFSLTCSQALSCGWLVVTNPMPGESLPLEIYGDLVADARAGGARTLVDLSSPRLDGALAARPDLGKGNDWELALVLHGEEVWRLSTPRFEHGFREGCGDSMMGALAAAWASGASFERALVLGAAAGAANFRGPGHGHASREVVEQPADAVRLEPWPIGVDV